jgi:hypothetical protein
VHGSQPSRARRPTPRFRRGGSGSSRSLHTSKSGWRIAGSTRSSGAKCSSTRRPSALRWWKSASSSRRASRASRGKLSSNPDETDHLLVQWRDTEDVTGSRARFGCRRAERVAARAAARLLRGLQRGLRRGLRRGFSHVLARRLPAECDTSCRGRARRRAFRRFDVDGFGGASVHRAPSRAVGTSCGRLVACCARFARERSREVIATAATRRRGAQRAENLDGREMTCTAPI